MLRATNRFRARLISWVVGGAVGLLLARLLARLLAGREDNPVLAGLDRLTDPFVGLFQRLDGGQPHFGAVLELSTVALIVLLALLGYIGWRLVRNRQPDQTQEGNGDV